MSRSGYHAALGGDLDLGYYDETWSLCPVCGNPTNYRNLCECHNGTVSETLAFFNSINTCPECLRPNTDHAPGCYNDEPDPGPPTWWPIMSDEQWTREGWSETPVYSCPPVITCADCGAEDGAHEERCMPGRVE